LVVPTVLPSQVPKKRTVRRALIIECDADKLQAQNLALGEELARNTMWKMMDFEIEFVSIRSDEEFSAKLKGLGRKRRHAIVIIGHSNKSLIRIAPGLTPGWEDVGRRLARFRPEKMLLIACQAGDPTVGDALFSAISSLRRIFACPINLRHDNSKRVLELATLLLGAVDLHETVRMALQGVHMLINDGLFFELRREDFSSPKKREEAEGRAALAKMAYAVLCMNKTGPVYARVRP
jgi:hypothetical protein